MVIQVKFPAISTCALGEASKNEPEINQVILTHHVITYQNWPSWDYYMQGPIKILATS